MRTLPLVITAVALATFAAGCGGGSDEEAGVATTVSEAAPAPETDRYPAPAIAGVSLDEESISLADYRGRAVLVNVWSSW